MTNLAPSAEHGALTAHLQALRAKACRGSRTQQRAIELANARIKTANTREGGAGIKPLAKQTVSDWLTGKTPPDDYLRLWALVQVLEEWAGAPPDSDGHGRSWWHGRRAMWQQLWKQARAGRPTDEPTARRRTGMPIADADPIEDLEVHPAIDAGHRNKDARFDNGGRLPVYVERDHDRHLARDVASALHRSRLRVLVADSSTGKTRALWHAIQRLPDPWRVWQPADRSALLAGLAREPSLAQTVVWLNDLQRYLLPNGQPEPDGQAASALRGLLKEPERGPVFVVGTLWHHHHKTLTRQPSSPADPDPHEQARALLNGRCLTVPELFADETLDALKELARHDARLAEALRNGGQRITQYLAGSRELIRRYEEASPEARAVLEAAIDARRLGAGRDLPHDFLFAFAAAYLDPGHWNVQTDAWRATWFDRALEETCPPSRGIPGPLAPPISPPGQLVSTGRVYRLADYLEQHGRLTRQRKAPPPSFWDVARSSEDPKELFALAESARTRLRLKTAFEIHERAAELGNSNSSLLLALLRIRVGDAVEARRFAAEAADANAHAATVLALLQEEKTEEAELYQVGPADGLIRRYSPTYLMFLLREVAQSRRLAGNLARQAVEAGQGYAHQQMALWKLEDGDWDAAVEHARSASAMSDPRLDGTRALDQISLLRKAMGGYKNVGLFYREVLFCCGHEGLLHLALLRRQIADGQRVQHLAEQARDSGHTNLLLRLVFLAKSNGDPGQAEWIAQQAVDAGSHRALVPLATLRTEAGDHQGAERLVRRAVDAGAAMSVQSIAELTGKREWQDALRFGLNPDGTTASPW
ncbi:hypothetical protein [Streptomyces sp. NPDC046925]|uniref:hypothetical protein n=1 Tax=Streptomyces sp. NPDC046925 TaxID=3155375 RepID=UPI0033FE558F